MFDWPSSQNSEAYQASQLHDLPPIAGAIIWAKQIERQLFSHMKRVEDVLGKGWELYAEGQKLQSESTSFRRKLDTRPVYEAWLSDITKRDMSIFGRLLDIHRNRVKGGQLELTVNFDPQIISSVVWRLSQSAFFMLIILPIPDSLKRSETCCGLASKSHTLSATSPRTLSAFIRTL